MDAKAIASELLDRFLMLDIIAEKTGSTSNIVWDAAVKLAGDDGRTPDEILKATYEKIVSGNIKVVLGNQK